MKFDPKFVRDSNTHLKFLTFQLSNVKYAPNTPMPHRDHDHTSLGFYNKHILPALEVVSVIPVDVRSIPVRSGLQIKSTGMEMLVTLETL